MVATAEKLEEALEWRRVTVSRGDASLLQKLITGTHSINPPRLFLVGGDGFVPWLMKCGNL
jgi:hypothetical protein